MASFVLLAICGTSISTFMGSKIITRAMLNEALKEMRHNLQSADMIYDSKLEAVKKSIIAVAQTEQLAIVLEPGKNRPLASTISKLRNENHLDFLTFIDTQNPRMLRALLSNFSQPGANQYPIRDYLKNALSGRVTVGTEILLKESLIREDKALAEQARMPILSGDTSSDPQTEIEEGMVLVAAAPVETRSGFKGVLYGGILLNHNTDLVSQIKNFLFESDAHTDPPSGTVSIFMRDVCIASNVLNSTKQPELGTRLKPEVHRTVLLQGRPYYGRANTNGSRYLIASHPIRNQKGRTVGILSLETPENSFLEVRTSMTLTFLLVACIGTLLVLGITYFITRGMN